MSEVLRLPRMEESPHPRVQPLSPLSEFWHAATARKRPHGDCGIVHLRGHLDRDALESAVRKVQEEQPILATMLREERAGLFSRLIRVPASSFAQFTVEEPAGRETFSFEALLARIRPHYEEPFDLFRDPPVRFRLLPWPKEIYSLVVNTHHVCADGFLVVRLGREILAHYDRLVTGRRTGTSAIPRMKSVKKPSTLRVNRRSNFRDAIWEAYLRNRYPVVGPRGPFGRAPSSKWSFSRLELGNDALGRLRSKACREGISLNDLLNITIVETIDELRGSPKELMSVCIPQHLRRYRTPLEDDGNFTAGFYVHLRPCERITRSGLIRAFVSQRRRAIKNGRAYFNLILLGRLLRMLHPLPVRTRAAVIERLAFYPTTFFCSNMGIIEPRPVPSTERNGRRSGAGGLEILGCDAVFPPNRSTDFSLMSFAFHDTLNVYVSTYDDRIPREEAAGFRRRLERNLLAGG